MDRRAFFQNIVSKASEVATDHAEALVNKAAAHWIRPPFAVDELELLTSCTRCGECIEACAETIIFPLQAHVGTAVGTPALDLLNNACLMCDDWPCVNACEAGVLQIPKESTALPRIAYAEIDIDLCLPYQGPECSVCLSACPISGALQSTMDKPVINNDLCTGCAQCREACITSPKSIKIYSRHQHNLLIDD